MSVVPLSLSVAFLLLSSCASWSERRAASRTRAEIQEGLARLPVCSHEVLAAALQRVPIDAPVGTYVTLRGNVRVGLEEGRYADCLGNEEAGCAPYTGPWLLQPAAGGAELFELYAAEGDEMGWVSREGRIETLMGVPLANVVVQGTLGSTLQPDARAQGRHRRMTFGSMCRVAS